MTEFIVDAVILALLGVAGLSIVASVALFILVIVAQFWRNDGAVLPEEDYFVDVTTDDSDEVVSFEFEHVDGHSASWQPDSELIVFSNDDTDRYESRAAKLSDAHDQFREFVANQTTELCYP